MLIVDDDEVFCELAGEALRDLASCEFALSGRAAWEKFKAAQFDCLLVDWRMPGMDGPELIQACRMLRPAQRIVLVSGHPEAEAYQARPQYTPDCIVVKPVSFDLLRRALVSAVKQKGNGHVGEVLAGNEIADPGFYPGATAA